MDVYCYSSLRSLKSIQRIQLSGSPEPRKGFNGHGHEVCALGTPESDSFGQLLT
jgi:hypothetical protein